jgi:hypothetical protein
MLNKGDRVADGEYIFKELREFEKDQLEKHSENVEKLSRIETLVEVINKKIVGNGQPGIEQRLSELEKNVVKIMTGVGIFLALMEGGHIALEHFFK